MTGKRCSARQRNGGTMKDSCLIISGAPSCHIPELSGKEYVIACDYGLHHAAEHGIRPHLIMGDFDSYSGTLPEGIPVQRFPSEKDDTDTMLAVKEALNRGFTEIAIAGGLGGRIDHQLANIAASVFAAARGARCTLVDEHHRIFALCGGTCRVAAGQWKILSVFAYSDRAEGVTLKGLKYPLSEGVLTSEFPLGARNSFEADTAEITVRRGTLLIVLSD